jgi:hypothetical protein
MSKRPPQRPPIEPTPIPPTPIPPLPSELKPTLRQSMDNYKWKLNVTAFPCLMCNNAVNPQNCIDYTPRVIQMLDAACQEPWPDCLCGHNAQQHDPNYVIPTK